MQQSFLIQWVLRTMRIWSSRLKDEEWQDVEWVWAPPTFQVATILMTELLETAPVIQIKCRLDQVVAKSGAVMILVEKFLLGARE
mmetsp:Transcript_32286/g.58402  ORF Transcript_32286/g.58402 Transcript_32286/m.58402 type:complete len:85 (+) Transcript_32286:2856-3110(+)